MVVGASVEVEVGELEVAFGVAGFEVGGEFELFFGVGVAFEVGEGDSEGLADFGGEGVEAHGFSEGFLGASVVFFLDEGAPVLAEGVEARDVDAHGDPAGGDDAEEDGEADDPFHEGSCLAFDCKGGKYSSCRLGDVFCQGEDCRVGFASSQRRYVQSMSQGRALAVKSLDSVVDSKGRMYYTDRLLL